ncbi:MAG: radical SAM protein [Candidatus Omnitrophota bacterium]
MLNKQKKLLLIIPPWNYVYKSLSLISREIVVAPPLGLLYIAAVAQMQDWNVKIVDMDAEGLLLPDALEVIKGFLPDLIGFSVATPFFNSVVGISRGIKEQFDIPVIIGGAHPTVVGECSVVEGIDFAMMGESELSFAQFLRSFVGERDYSSIPGLIFRQDGKIVVNPHSSSKVLMDELPLPARQLLPLESYKVNLPGYGQRMYTSITTSRGCPYECIFCSVATIFGRSLRFRPVDLVVNEIEECKTRYGITHFHFVDDTLTVKRDYTIELCNLLIEKNLNITWEGWTRADCIDEVLLRLMKESGFMRISFGLETGNKDIMALIKKRVTHDQIHNAFALAGKLGIESRCSVMIGHPGETKKTVWETINFVRNERDIFYSNLSIATPYPGTQLAHMAAQGDHGLRLLSSDPNKFVRYFSPVMEMNDLSAKDLKSIQMLGLVWIHLTPRRIYHAVRRFGMKNIIISMFSMGLTFIRMFFKGDRKKNE